MKFTRKFISVMSALVLLVSVMPLSVSAAALKITTQPKTGYTSYGSTATATVKAKGDGLKYTWYVKNAGKTKYTKSSITKSTYSVKMTDSVKNRSVYCVVKDKKGKTVKSKTAILRMKATITTEPTNVTVKKGSSAKVTLKAKGDGLKYTWYVKNAGKTKYSKSSVTKSTYSVTMSDKVNGRYIYCIVTDKYGKTDKSKTVVLKQKTSPLTITMQPESTTARVGDEVGFGIVVSGGTKPYTYEWQAVNSVVTEWAKIDVETLVTGNMVTALIPVEEIVFTTSFLFRCVVTDAKGNQVISNVVWIDKLAAASPLTIDWQTSDLSVNVGDNIELKVEVSGGSESYTYEWQLISDDVDDWVVIDSNIMNGSPHDTDTLTFAIHNVHINDHYRYRCIITDSEGEQVISKEIRILENLPEFVITSQPENETAQVNDTVSFTVAVSGGKAPYTYQWQCTSDGMSGWQNCKESWANGATTDTVSFAVEQTDFDYNYRYRCMITDNHGNKIFSNEVWVTQD